MILAVSTGPGAVLLTNSPHHKKAWACLERILSQGYGGKLVEKYTGMGSNMKNYWHAAQQAVMD